MFRERLAEFGYVEGKTIVIDERFAEGSMPRLTMDANWWQARSRSSSQ